MAVTTMPATMMPSGMVRRGFLTSWPTIEAISNPEKAKHIDDHRLMVVMKSSRGSSSEDANDVADPNVTNAIVPQTTSRAGGIHVAMAPMCCTHFAVSRPRMLIPVQNHMKPRTNTTE